MLLILLAYLGGVLTIVSPCILPVLPFVFSRASQPFVRSGLPLLAGMALTFAAVATLAAVGGGWVVAANQYGRWAALVLVAVFGLALVWPGLADRMARPLVAAGDRLSQTAQGDGQPRVGASLLLGVATGLLWAPCAGPVLGLILTGAALKGASVGTSLLLLAYAAGAATSMAAALLLGGRVFAALKRSLGVGEWVRRGLGAAMLAGVAAIALGLDTGVLARLSTASTGGIEQALVNRLGNEPQGGAMAMGGGPSMMMQGGGAMMAAAGAEGAGPSMMAVGNAAAGRLPDQGEVPSLDGAVQWLNSPALTTAGLRGKVVLVDFWTYSCINCLRAMPYVKAWAEKYKDQGLVVVGVHAPEFAFERDAANVAKAVRDLGITYPVAIDNNYAIWRAFQNRYWPAHYLIDAQGRMRYHHFGEGNYAESERAIQQLLREAGTAATPVRDGLAQVAAQGVHQPADLGAVRSQETYLGYERAEHFASAEPAVRDRAATYTAPARPALNAWGLAGQWTVGAERATLAAGSGRIVYRFQARDLHLVLGPGTGGKPVRFKVTVDGQAPGESRGIDVAADGIGTVTDQRLYQLVRQGGEVRERTFSIEFLDAPVDAYAFTFG
ncbi:cytochrome c biogenesis protein DipZ [Acidovorax sp. Root219]|uniref:cytochrome c biogenesis protein DipZ n=1 Tax=Acidovorax sp. Root219 TaxID=1736493 RepID=UPI00070AE4FD|nr:cytochrome c biogenesis protein DipZ [Acidovorax sp. Root219]KRC26353.1 cytochrome C biogenesis protein [Acidovorax sp. Root219]